jgi:hypothetical protein
VDQQVGGEFCKPARASSCPEAAAQPIRGGIAPTTAPTQVFATLTTFRGVYTAAYSAMFEAPNAAVVVLAFRTPRKLVQHTFLFDPQVNAPTTESLAAFAKISGKHQIHLLAAHDVESASGCQCCRCKTWTCYPPC